MFKQQHKSFRGTIGSPEGLYKNLLEYSFKLLTRRRYSIHEITNKLEKRAILITNPQADTPTTPEPMPQETISEVIKRVIERLINYKYLNDREYTQLFIQDQLNRKPQGIRLLQEKLKHKGIAKAIVQETMANINPNELEQAKIALEKKKKTLKSSSIQNEKEKLFYFLVSRGFSTSTILTILK